MARKNVLSNLIAPASEKLTPVNPVQDEHRQHVTYKGIGALGAVTRSIDALAAKADAAKEIEAKLTAGEVVIELEPDQIEESFVSDRLAHSDQQFQELVEAMRVRGQDSPILVRPHPAKDGVYQIAFGHRRAKAARLLGRPVRAVVKALTDRDHVIAQGQENSARADLSFLERATFAGELETRGFDRETIMAALSADKTTVSKMLSVVNRIPKAVRAGIGGSSALVGRRALATRRSLSHGIGNALSALGPKLRRRGAKSHGKSQERHQTALGYATGNRSMATPRGALALVLKHIHLSPIV